MRALHVVDGGTGEVVEGLLPTLDRSGDCWIWTRCTTPRGYGHLSRVGLGGHIYAHRLFYEAFIGPIPAGLDIDHLCRNTSCVNPEHLKAVSRGENIRRGEGPGLLGRRNASKTHCPRGHPYDTENTRIRRGGRECLECCRERNARWRASR